MIKKLLILLLFFGLSFGQESNREHSDTILLSGSWTFNREIQKNLDINMTFFLEEDGTGYQSMKTPQDGSQTYNILWEIKPKGEKHGEPCVGTFIQTTVFKSGNETTIYKYYYLTKEVTTFVYGKEYNLKDKEILVLQDIINEISWFFERR